MANLYGKKSRILKLKPQELCFPISIIDEFKNNENKKKIIIFLKIK